MPSNANCNYSTEATALTALCSSLEAEAPNVAINLPLIAEAPTATSAERPGYVPLLPTWCVIGAHILILLLSGVFLICALSALVFALNFLFNRSPA